jgi:hypothetical protein
VWRGYANRKPNTIEPRLAMRGVLRGGNLIVNSYGIRFIGDYYSLFTTVTADNEEQAERLAVANLSLEYGFEIGGTYHEVEIELEGEYA